MNQTGIEFRTAGEPETRQRSGDSQRQRRLSGAPFCAALYRNPATLKRHRWLLFFAIALAAGIWLQPERVPGALLLSSFYLVTLALAGAVFIAIHYAAGAAWPVAFRRVPEAMAATLPLGGIAIWLVLLSGGWVYAWMSEPQTIGSAGFKAFWLEPVFFKLRAVLYIALWLVFTALLLRNSRRQDFDASVKHSRKNVALSAGFLVVFAVTFWLASFDWIMSLEPHWYSTIFGIYQFAGLFLGGLAAITLLVNWLEHLGPLRGFLREDHLHDLGKLLFAFSSFWMYIWFSQYMLIWYANIPEEAGYYVTRTTGRWGSLFVASMVLNWLAPFLILLPRKAKQSRTTLVRVAVIVLVGRWLDLYLMIMPALAPDAPLPGLPETASWLLSTALFAMAVLHVFSRRAPVPINDPRLQESLTYHSS